MPSFAGVRGDPRAAAQHPGLLSLRLFPHRPQSPRLELHGPSMLSCLQTPTDTFPFAGGPYGIHLLEKLLTKVSYSCIYFFLSYNKEMLSPLNGLLSSNITGTALYRNGFHLGRSAAAVLGLHGHLVRPEEGSMSDPELCPRPYFLTVTGDGPKTKSWARRAVLN